MPQMIIASRLADGVVVFLAEDHSWTRSIGAGAVVDAPAEGERLLAVAKEHEAACIVTDPYLIDVELDGQAPKPVSIREAIRAFGPTFRSEAAEDGENTHVSV